MSDLSPVRGSAPATSAASPPAPRAGTCSGTKYCLIVAFAIGAMLQFAAIAKLLGPDPKKFLISPGDIAQLPGGVLLDYVVAGGEIVVVMVLLAFHRSRWVWALVALMFSAFAGYAYQAHLRGVPCGCFAKLWTPPAAVSAGIDVAFVVLSLVSLIALRTRWWGVLLTVLLIPALGYTGFLYADKALPPPPTTLAGQTGADRLLASDLLKDIAGQPAGGPHWYVFVYDPQCHTCEMLKPVVDMMEETYRASADRLLQVRQLTVEEIKEKSGIDIWEWSPTPTVLLIKDGRVIGKWNGEEAKVPDQDFYTQLGAGQFGQ